MTRLSVNVNKVAVLRNARGGDLPDPAQAARVAIEAGCHGITVHPRPDQRHIRTDDVERIADAAAGVEYNIEGNPFAAARDSYPGLIELVRRTRPAQVTLVPDTDGQITSDHGFRLDDEAAARLAVLIREFHGPGCRVSLFMDPGSDDIGQAADIGADRIELYTGPFAAAHERGDFRRELDALVASAELARANGLAVNAGHDLDQRNLGALVGAIPDLAEVSIGHALFGEALYSGLATTVRRYLAILADPAG
jgi:pyridoxine 5-phosphate synthase